MTTLLRKGLNQWQRMSSARRLALLISIVGVLATVAAWAALSSQVTYDIAFSEVKQTDAAGVVDKLRSLNIPYELESNVDGTTTIRVPSQMVDEARIRVAGAGLLQGGSTGFEIFNQPSFGLSDFIQQVDYQRALEGELSRSIGEIDGVEAARVHLAIPHPSVFLSQQQDPSAAVVVSLKPGYLLSRSQSQAIVQLVVGAVQGMKPSQVVLLDTEGRLLHETGDGSTGLTTTGQLSDQYTTERTMEQDLQTRLQSMLDSVLGPGHSTTQVSLDLDWSQGQSTTETYLPNGQQPAIQTDQETRDTTSSSSNSTLASVPPGVGSNVPSYQQTLATPTVTVTPTVSTTPGATTTVTAVATASAVSTPTGPDQHYVSNRTYALSKTTDQSQRPPGTIKRVSVSIAVDKNGLDPTTVDTITKMAQAAVGYNAARGDTVTVVALPMKSNQSPPTTTAKPGQWQTFEIARLAALAIGPVLAILAIGGVLLRRRSPRSKRLPAAGRIVNTVDQLTAGASGTPPALANNLLAAEDNRVLTRSQLAELADKHPALVASILQAWVSEDRRDSN